MKKPRVLAVEDETIIAWDLGRIPAAARAPGQA